MRTVLSAAILLLILAAGPTIVGPPATARGEETGFTQSKAPVKKQIQSVIQAQLAAFRSGNYQKAYTYASVGIRRRFAAAAFAEMVRSAYPAIARSRTAQFGAILDDSEQAVAHVLVEGTGDRVLYVYLLVRERGLWKIESVIEAQKPSLDGEVSI
ncbi:DUF4864 domain-containing protein [Gloeobacter kilaueensis]|uniref:DUF4864 domain-containing protein n=1 Tax=Gloeobacter kilaueensis (strain ATCC BAA-2537 / CCAP 1431/1 / ULC 316 / JS1) TaxID=1183438 RepID=U5QMH2_GLOK1|nr:DUF4864 domain-containing protein [Gloeobacter kilaueensis]AGY60202.1 hypothetical protein GKIL_3956 [Gloeobacter kilaueensis JS1]